MNHDRRITISTGSSRLSKSWAPVSFMWSEFVNRLSIPQRTAETFEAYQKLSKAEKGRLKDVGGFVGGTLKGPQRKSDAVTGRDLVTLDLDNIASGETENTLRKVDSLGMGYAIYSTRSHAPYAPRLRIIIPLDRTVTADEYEPIARRLAALIGIEMCDATTFEACRLMFWPSCSSDAPFVFASADKPFVSSDGILAMYADWHDVRTWPQVPGKETRPKELLARQQDPTQKKGIVGAFCRTYDIRGAIEAFIPKAYADTDKEDRLTYTGGTTVAGAVVYDDGKFLFSHHATDPCSGQLVNAFDLVRLHRFGSEDLEAKDGTPINKMPSYVSMKKLAMEDQHVLQELNQTAAEVAASTVFEVMEGGPAEPQSAAPAEAAQDVSWMTAAKLQYDSNTGKPKKSRDNVIRILLNDPALKGKIATDEFAMRGVALDALPWDTREGMRLWTDTDDSGLNWYLETRYGITGQTLVDDALRLVSKEQAFNAVKEYLESLYWDGVPRVGTVFQDYLGAEDTAYVRAVCRKSLVAAVARVFEPGCKYDYVPVIIGPQGLGKTSFLRTLAHGWHSDSLSSFHGKEASEQIQGIWIVEIGEMTAAKRSDNNEIKQFLSRCDDVYRQPYGRRTERYPRKGVFFGTTNENDFLTDTTGNRRFWPVDGGVRTPTLTPWEDLPGQVDQIWAEAVTLYKKGEPLYMETEELKHAAKEAQEGHRDTDARAGMIEEFINRPVPDNYDNLSLSTRRMWWSGNLQNATPVKRTKVCALEIWCECLNGDIKQLRRQDSATINNILAGVSGWRRNKSIRRYGYCGRQRGYECE
ncbi:VapE domain-containing protein [Acidaminococcus intestini]|uniref:VapE domain-containing protein n=1 Tax=Acidaminococcus intestini TaxID=187327 RepID=UPI003AB51BAC